MATDDHAQFQKLMNVNRLIWITTTVLFALVGAMLGSSLGHFYVSRTIPGSSPLAMKYLAGSEIGAGVFTADTVPEEKVKELQAVQVDVDA